MDEVRWYQDEETGKMMKRAGFRALQEDIFRGEVKTVIMWKLDRSARSLREAIYVLPDWCQCDVRVVSVTQQIDLSGTVGHRIASLLFGIAEMELRQIKERQAAGIAEAKERGIYERRKRGTTEAKPEPARKLHANGLQPPGIANALNGSERTVFRYLAS